MVPAHAALDDGARRLMAEIGPRWGSDVLRHRDLVLDAYGPWLAVAPKDGIVVSRDIRYGPHPRHVLDSFLPEGAAGRPIIAFLHGGAFVRGERRASPEVSDNLLFWFARQGYLGLNIEYRLAPESRWPGGADDLALALDWVRSQAPRLGGDPERIVAIGHSAGGTHVATYAFDPSAGYLGRHLSGIVLVSARLRADVLPQNPLADGVRAYFGDDPDLHEARSPLSHAAAGSLPVMIAIAEYENPLLDIYALEFALALAKARGRAPPFLRLAGHNHMSIIAHVNTVEDRLGRDILAFIEALG